MRPRENWQGLQVAKKSYCGVTVGYVVGWWRFRSGGFQSFREGVVFTSRTKAEQMRDRIERLRSGFSGVEFSKLED